MSEIIEVQDVCKKYSDKLVLDHISFSIKKGEIFGLLGPSGAGKTTLIRLLTTQTPKSSGKIRVLQCDVDAWDSSLNKKIGIMADNCGLYERLTCYENLKFYCTLYGKPHFIIDSLLDQVGLLNAKNKLVCDLSKGMSQRLSLLRAMLNFPELLFLDEPTSDLDPNTTLRIHKLIKSLKDQGTTIFLTTHDMTEATKLCDTVGLLSHGKLIEFGTPAALCMKYNLDNSIIITNKDGKETVVSNDSSSASLIYDYFKHNNVAAIRSSELNLEQLFIKLTGEGIQNDNEKY